MSLGWNQWEARLTSYKAKGQVCGNAKPRSQQSIGMLTKSDFNRYLECPIHLWLHRHRRNSIVVEMDDMKLQWIFEQGNMVESYARVLLEGLVGRL